MRGEWPLETSSPVSQEASGVFPVPPQEMFPMETQGTGGSQERSSPQE
jgi:hypothetical protein